MASKLDIAWLAGLLEGEGSFLLDVRRNRPNNRPVLVVCVKMTDKDVIERALSVFPSNSKMYGVEDPRPNKSYCWMAQWNGKPAEQLMRAVLPFMGTRRSAKIRGCLETPNLSHTPRLKAAA